MTDLETREDVTVRPTTGDGDHERFAHIVWAPGGNPGAVIMEAMVTGTPVRALCGKVWVPSRDPKRYPVCPGCKEVKDALQGRGGGGSDAGGGPGGT